MRIPSFDTRHLLALTFSIPLALPACGGTVESTTCSEGDPACTQQTPVTDTSPTEPAPGSGGDVGSSMPHAGTSTLDGLVGEWDVAYATRGTCTNVPDAKPTDFSGAASVTLAATAERNKLAASSDLWFGCPNLELSPSDPFVATPDLRGVCRTDSFAYTVTLAASTSPAKLTIAIRQSLGDGANGKPASCDYTVTATAKKR